MKEVKILQHSFLMSKIHIKKNKKVIKLLAKNLRKCARMTNRLIPLKKNIFKYITFFLKKPKQLEKKNVMPLFTQIKNKKIKNIIVARQIKKKLYLIKLKIKKKIAFSYLKLINYLWLLFKPQNKKIMLKGGNKSLTNSINDFLNNKVNALTIFNYIDKKKYAKKNQFVSFKKLLKKIYLKKYNFLNYYVGNYNLEFRELLLKIIILQHFSEIKTKYILIKNRKKSIVKQYFEFIASLKKKKNKPERFFKFKNKSTTPFIRKKKPYNYLNYLKKILKKKELKVINKLKPLSKIKLNLNKKLYKYPKYLQINFKLKSAILLHYPKINQIPLSFSIKNKLKLI